MGQTQSSLPSGKNYKYSYCKQLNNLPYVNLPPILNLSHLIFLPKNDGSSYILKLIYTAIYYKIKHLGYNIKETTNHFIHTNIQLSTIIENVCNHGIKSSGKEILNDLTMTGKPYKVSLNNIKNLLSSGNILIAGIVIDEKFGKDVLQQNISSLLTDIIIIIGYNQSSLFIYSNWKEEIIEIDYIFVDNILEIWNIEVNSPEEYFLNKEKN